MQWRGDFRVLSLKSLLHIQNLHADTTSDPLSSVATELQTCRSNDVKRNTLGIRMDVDDWGTIGIGDCVKQRITKLRNHRMLIWA
jgi:hypothetical protein